MSDEAKSALVVGVIVGTILMGILMTFVGDNATYKTRKLREKCELNIPRSQICIMQFVPEKK